MKNFKSFGMNDASDSVTRLTELGKLQNEALQLAQEYKNVIIDQYPAAIIQIYVPDDVNTAKEGIERHEVIIGGCDDLARADIINRLVHVYPSLRFKR